MRTILFGIQTWGEAFIEVDDAMLFVWMDPLLALEQRVTRQTQAP
jgi:hypothetical protein